MTHPKEAVEAVARAMCEDGGSPPWRWLKESFQDEYRTKATSLLDKIAPHYDERAAHRCDEIADQFARNNQGDKSIGAKICAAAIRKGE